MKLYQITCAIRHSLNQSKSIYAEPPENKFTNTVYVRNRFTLQWIKTSAGVLLLRPNAYDLWLPK